MKYLLALCLSLNLYSNPLPLIDIKGFSGDFNNDRGSGNVARFLYEDYDFTESTFSIEKQADTLLLKTEDEEIILDSIPEFINELQSIDWDHVGLTLNEENVELTIPALEGKSADNDLTIKGLTLKCDLTDLDEELGKVMYDSCFNKKGSLKFSKYSTKSKDKKRITIYNFSLTMIENQFNLYIRYQNKNIKGYGRIYYRNNKIEMNIWKLKAGIFNAKKILFKELSKQQTDGFEAKNPWIKIDVD